MASLQLGPLLLLSLPSQSRTPSLLLTRTNWTTSTIPRLRGSSSVARLGFGDFHTAEGWAREAMERAEGFVYTVADAAVSSTTSPAVAGAVVEEGQKQGRDWLSGITDYMESVLKVLKDGLSALHVPYSYGFAIILLTILVKAATFPLTKKQVESALAMKSLQPQVKAVQERYAGDQERIQLETARLYKLAGVNPLAGCLPTLATIPVWIGLYRALSNVANEGLLSEGFFWIPSLAGPTTIAARQNGSGISWLFPFVDGNPPLGWSDTLAYLVLPVLLVVSQYISAQIMQPQTQGNDPSQKNAQAITKFLPLMIGYFALSVPSGLSLYWFTNNVLSTAQQIWLQKLGGAKNTIKKFNGGSVEAQLSNQTDLEVGLRKEISSQAKISTQVKSDSGGPRPGDRFKQIKEQEARRKQEREEKKRAEEAAKRNNEEMKPNFEIIERVVWMEESTSLSGIDKKSSHSIPMDDSSKVAPAKINGSHAKEDLSEVKNDTQSPVSRNSGLAQNANAGKDELDSEKNTQKKESY